MTDNSPAGQAGPSARVVLLAMLASIIAVGVTLGITAPLFSVVLDHMGLSSALIGLNTSLGIGATLIMAPFVPRMLTRVRPVPIMLGGIVLSAGGLLGAGFLRTVVLWFVLRFVIGVGMSLHWVISETCINQFSSEHNRGLIAGVYSALFGLGFAIGPLVLRITGVNGPMPFIVSASLVLAAALPLLWIRGNMPSVDGFSLSSQQSGRVGINVLRLASVTLLASLISGFMDSATLALLPLYGLELGMEQAGAIALLTVVALGAVALQLPIGWVADRLGRRVVLLGCAVTSIVAVLLLPFVFGRPWFFQAVLFFWGGVVVAFYTLALTLLGSMFRGPALARASSSLVIAYCLGSVIGPPIAGAAMDGVGPNGLVFVMAAAAALLALAVMLRFHAGHF